MIGPVETDGGWGGGWREGVCIVDKFWEVYLTLVKAIVIAAIWSVQLPLMGGYLGIWAVIGGLNWMREKVEEWKPMRPDVFRIPLDDKAEVIWCIQARKDIHDLLAHVLNFEPLLRADQINMIEERYRSGSGE